MGGPGEPSADAESSVSGLAQWVKQRRIEDWGFGSSHAWRVCPRPQPCQERYTDFVSHQGCRLSERPCLSKQAGDNDHPPHTHTQTHEHTPAVHMLQRQGSEGAFARKASLGSESALLKDVEVGSSAVTMLGL